MTDLFILLAVVTVVCTGAAVPCFFKSTRNTAGCLILSVAVLAAAAACFTTPVKSCFAAFSRFDCWYYGCLFAAAFIVSLFYRPLLGIAAILYVLWCSVFLFILLPVGYSPSASIGEITVTSSAQKTYQLEEVSLSPYFVLPFSRHWYRSADKDESAELRDWGRVFLTTAGAVFSSEKIPLPESTVYPHVYFLSIAADGSASFETVF